MAREFEYEAEREVKTYVYLYNAARNSLGYAQKEKQGSLYAIISSLVFSAFALEAYLNHLGEQKIKYWAEIDRIPTDSKLRLLAEEFDVTLDFGARPAQTIGQLFRFRNLMAHGRTERLTGTGRAKHPDLDPSKELVETAWEKFCNEEEATRALDDVSALVTSLNEAAGLGPDPFLSAGRGSVTIRERRSKGEET